MNQLMKLSSAFAFAMAIGFSATPSFAKAHDQGVGDGSGLNRPLSDLGTSNTGGSGATIGGPGSFGISENQKNGARGAKASAAGSTNSGAHGDFHGQIDDAVRN